VTQPEQSTTHTLADPWMTVPEVATYTRTLGRYQSPFKIRRAAQSGALEAKKTRPGLKAHWIFQRSAVNAWLRSGALTYGEKA
jgi:hypothetical protein